MNRKLILAGSALTLISLSAAQQDGTPNRPMPTQPSNSAYEGHRQAAIQINELAGHIHSSDDSRALVDRIATMFADHLPPEWTTQKIRARIARAEFQSATDPAALIPEQRVADAWNRYVRAIGASDEALINVAEIHNLRDGYYATSLTLWPRGPGNIWTMPNIYAVGPDGKVANGCRAVESVRVLADITNFFDNLRASRDRVRKGIVLSDQFQPRQDDHSASQTRFEISVRRASENPVQAAAIRYVREHGVVALSQRIEELLTELFPDPVEP